MPDSVPGRTDGRNIIWLDKGLNQVERRCALTHELIHIERSHFGCQRPAVEAQVCAETARRLIPLDILAKGLSWSLYPTELADELWVTPEVLHDRLVHLTDEELEALVEIELQHF